MNINVLKTLRASTMTIFVVRRQQRGSANHFRSTANQLAI